MAKIVKNQSQGYGYSYSNLADLANAGIEIPQMRVKPVFTPDGSTYVADYIEYRDKNGEWHLGAKIVVPNMGKANEAQCYGAALTYSRRYSVELAESVACNDDDEIEKTKGAPEATGRVYGGASKVNFTEVREKLGEIDSVEDLNKYWTELHLTDKQANILKADFAKRKAQIGGE